MTDEQTSTNPFAAEPFGAQPPDDPASAVQDATEEAQGMYVPRVHEAGDKLPSLAAEPLLLPKRKPHPGKPRRRTWVDNDGDLWWEVKGSNEVLGFQEGGLVNMDFGRLQRDLGPLIELDSVNITTAVENAIDQTLAWAKAMVHHHAEDQDNTIARAAMFELLNELDKVKR